MTLSELQREAGALTAEERRQFAAFLTALRMKDTGEWDCATAPEPAGQREGWVSLDDAKRRLLGS